MRGVAAGPCHTPWSGVKERGLKCASSFSHLARACGQSAGARQVGKPVLDRLESLSDSKAADFFVIPTERAAASEAEESARSDLLGTAEQTESLRVDSSSALAGARLVGMTKFRAVEGDGASTDCINSSDRLCSLSTTGWKTCPTQPRDHGDAGLRRTGIPTRRPHQSRRYDSSSRERTPWRYRFTLS